MNSKITQAIQDRKMLELRYHGYSRIVEPYAYGNNKNIEEILRCYQVVGGSESGELAGWKLLKIGDIYSLHLTNKIFSIREEYQRNDKAMIRIFIQI